MNLNCSIPSEFFQSVDALQGSLKGFKKAKLTKVLRVTLWVLLFNIALLNNVTAASRYWVASSTASWNSTANWSVSSGGIGGASVPGAADIAIFNNKGLGNCNINISIKVLGFNISAGYTGTVTQMSGDTMNIGTTGYTQSSGTFTGGNSPIIITKAILSISGGTFTSTSGTLLFGGSFTANQIFIKQTAGVFNHNNGLVLFAPVNAGCTALTFTATPLKTQSFYDVKIVAQPSGCSPSCTFAVSGGDTLKCAHNLTHSDGILTGFYEFKNNLIVDSAADAGTGFIIADGTGAQTYSVTSSSPRTCGLMVRKPSGTLSAAPGTTNFAVQAFNLLNGTFTAPTGNFYIGGSWNVAQNIVSYTGGTFNHNNGTVIFDAVSGNCLAHAFNFNTTKSVVFYNLVLSTPYNCGVITKITSTYPVDSIVVANNLEFGRVSLHTNVIALGNVVVDTSFRSDHGSLTFAGTGNQTFDLTGATASFTGAIILNKINAATSTVNLVSPLVVSASIMFKKGVLVSTNTNTLIFNLAASATNMSDSSYVNGPVEKIGNRYFTYPVGQNSLYRPCGIDPPSKPTDAFTVQYFRVNPNVPGYNTNLHPLNIKFISQNEYWNISRTIGTSNVKVIFSWRDTITGLTEAASHMHVVHWNGSTWQDLGKGVSANSGNVPGPTVVTLAAVTSFSPFTLATDSILTISGTVYDDGNGLTDSKINGTTVGTLSSTQLFVNLLNSNGSMVLDTFRLSSNGAFSFSQLTGGNYKVQLSVNRGTIGSAPPITALPLQWINTAEGSTPTGDGMPNGITSVYVATTNLKNVNFGVNKLPVAGKGFSNLSGGGSGQVTVPATTFTSNSQSTDFENKVSSIVITAFPKNADTLTINGTPYTASSSVWGLGGVTVPASLIGLPTPLISVKPTLGRFKDTIFFRAVDSAGSISANLGNAILQYKFLKLGGTVVLDSNGITDLMISGSPIGNPNGSSLYVVIADSASGIILGNGNVNSMSGKFSISNIAGPNIPYKLLLSSTPGNIGNVLGTSTLPATWVNVGADYGNNNADGNGFYVVLNSLGIATGDISVRLGTVNDTTIKFGIERLPKAFNKTYNSLIGWSISGPSGNAHYPSKISLAYSASDTDVTSTTIFPGVVSGADVEDGAYCGAHGHYGSPSRIGFPSLPDSSKALLAYFDGFTYRILTPGNIFSPYWNTMYNMYVIPAFNANNLYLYGKDGVYSIMFTYNWVDAANVMGSTASYNLNLTSPLPVKLSAFEVVKNGTVAHLTWATASEENSDRFEIERSTDGFQFQPLGAIKAVGNTRSNVHYSFDDAAPATGTNYYRLKMVDNDASYQYSQARELNFDGTGLINFTLYPNPANGHTLSVGLNSTIQGNAVLKIFDLTGRMVITRRVALATGYNNISLDIQSLNTGLYLLNAEINGQVLSSKLSIIR